MYFYKYRHLRLSQISVKMKYVLMVKRLWKPILCCFIFLLLCELIYLKKDTCEEEDSMAQVQLLCTQYHKREIVGNMCSTLCDQSALRFQGCYGNRIGKKVIIMSCDGCFEPGKTSKVVLKIEYNMMTWQNLINTPLKTLNTTEEKIYRSTKEIQLKTLEYYETDLPDHKDLISLMLGENYENLVRKLNAPNSIDVVLQTAIGLGTQEEFLSHKVLRSPSFLPKLYGVCGPAYFVEDTPSLNSLKYIYFQSKKPDTLKLNLDSAPSWEDRAKAALSMLRMVLQAEDNYETPLQICDMASHNFGLSESGEVVMLDSDSITSGQVEIKGACELDNDCKYYFCQGYCNKTTKLCGEELTVNNLQLLCRKILLSEHEIFGLLRSPPSSIQEPLRKLLYQCRNPVPSVFKLPRENKSDRKLMREIEMLLKTSV